MKTDKLGMPRFSRSDLVDMIYSGNANKLHSVLCDATGDIDKFNVAAAEQGLAPLQTYSSLNVDQKTFDTVCQSEWFMPDEYRNIDVQEYLLTKCNTTKEKDRVIEEVEQFDQRGLMNVLRYMIYIVDLMRRNGIVWGVGRGSSVASYVLYLIGIHRIDSIKYCLDWREFLR